MSMGSWFYDVFVEVMHFWKRNHQSPLVRWNRLLSSYREWEVNAVQRSLDVFSRWKSAPMVQSETLSGFRELIFFDSVLMCWPRGMTVQKAALQISISLLPLKLWYWDFSPPTRLDTLIWCINAGGSRGFSQQIHCHLHSRLLATNSDVN